MEKKQIHPFIIKWAYALYSMPLRNYSSHSQVMMIIMKLHNLCILFNIFLDHALSIHIILSHTTSIHVYTVSCSCMYVKIQGKPICTMFLPLHLEEIKCIQPVLYTFFKIILQCSCILMTDQLQKDALLMALNLCI